MSTDQSNPAPLVRPIWTPDDARQAAADAAKHRAEPGVPNGYSVPPKIDERAPWFIAPTSPPRGRRAPERGRMRPRRARRIAQLVLALAAIVLLVALGTMWAAHLGGAR